MKKNKTTITKTPFELADALGLDPVEALAWQVRYVLVKKIEESVRKQRLTVTEVAKRSKTSRGRITSILKGESGGISLDILLRIVCAIGEEVKLTFKRSA